MSSRLENIAIRVMYLFNTMDSFLLISSAPFIVYSYLYRSGILFGVHIYALIFAYIVSYLCLKIADFHPLFLALTGLYAFFLWRLNPLLAKDALTVSVIMFALTSLVQLFLMGLPMGLASRRIDVPFRIYLHSFFILSPTTISLPLTVYYQTLLIMAAKAVSLRPFGYDSLFLFFSLLAGAIIARTFRKKQFIPAVFHPVSTGKRFRRAVIINIDGLSQHAFDKANPPFLKMLESNFTSVKGGAHTVYRALTNPAFASILSGSAPEVHRVLSNNLGQQIRTEALPDFIDSRLYGSMHVKHFSRSSWNVTTVSLVGDGFDKADGVLLKDVKQDMKAFNSVELWIIDLSQADYAGHAWGSYSKEYHEAILRSDAIVEDLILWMRREGLTRDSLIVISSDHGMFIGEHSFMISSQEEMVPLIFAGDGIVSKKISGDVSILDIAANISYCLGKRYCADSGGRVFTDMLGACDKEFLHKITRREN